MLVVTLLFLVLFTISVVIAVFAADWDVQEGFEIVSVISGLVLFVLLLTIPASRVCIQDEIKGIEAFQQTVTEQREINAAAYLTDLERATLTKKIALMNADIAMRHNKNVWWRSKLWIPRKWEYVKPIR